MVKVLVELLNNQISVVNSNKYTPNGDELKKLTK